MIIALVAVVGRVDVPVLSALLVAWLGRRIGYSGRSRSRSSERRVTSCEGFLLEAKAAEKFSSLPA